MNLLFSTNGRIPRWKFWLAYLPLLFGVTPLIIFIENYAGNKSILGLLVMGLYVWIAICLAAKRLHDADTHGAFSVFIVLVPIIAAIFIGIRPGTPGENRFGSDPLTSPAI